MKAKARARSGKVDGAKAGARDKLGASVGKRVRYAVIGLGHIAQAAVLPAFKHARGNSELAALVSDDPKKLKELGKRYKVGAQYGYADIKRCLAEASIDAVYIATPNTEHLPMILAAADAGVHVLCEKPLCATERECSKAIRACERAGVRLMTAYRLHFEAANLKVLELCRSGRIGEPTSFTSSFSYQVKDRENIRLRGDLGGGPVHDIGIYCINAARSIFQAEPTSVIARACHHGDARFESVPGTVAALLQFPDDRVATFTCSFGLATTSWYEILGTKGSIRADPAYEYAEGLALEVTVNEKTRALKFAKRDQFAPELAYFSRCVLSGEDPEPSGWEGLADVRVIEALQRSTRRGRMVTVRPTPEARHPSPRQRIDRPPVPREPVLVHAESASD